MLEDSKCEVKEEILCIVDGSMDPVVGMSVDSDKMQFGS